MKISHVGIKISLATLIMIIVITNLVYWFAVSSLFSNLSSLITVSEQQENGDLFHSSVHSMLIQSTNSNSPAQYNINRRQADETLKKILSHLEQFSESSDKSKLLTYLNKLQDNFSSFKHFTDTLVNGEEIGNNFDSTKILQKMFNSIFHDYRELYNYHSKQRDNLVIKIYRIKDSIRFIQILMIASAGAIGVLTLLYFDRVVLKLLTVSERLVVLDKLTGLYNRHGLERMADKLRQQHSRTGDNQYSVLMLDIDRFKKFNDTYGHPAGDQLLVQLSKLLLSSVRSQDKVIRYGGEEILILLPQSTMHGTKELANKICRKIAMTPFQINGDRVAGHVTVSIGYAISPIDEGSFDDILKVADQRLYFAKKSGRNISIGPEIQ